ncbi:MAG TPA: DUF4242 domain-containing protein [Gammaproteobacteria bacterium]|nr:DUF4242 domain-containing protein [Gammaproteobacteria bacterium]
MKKMKLFIDTHDRTKNTFPDGITEAQFGEFYTKFVEACEAEGVINLRAHVGIEEGRAYCFNMAPNVEAVKRAHERAGLPYDSITEVKTTTPGDMFFKVS